MEITNIKRASHFLREKPIKVNLFDRPRLVCEIICLEAEQEDVRQKHAASDALYFVVEGKGKLQAGSHDDDLEEQDVFVVPPGIDYTIRNPGPDRLTVMALVSPKPNRVSEVRMPTEGRRTASRRDEEPRDRELPSRGASAGERPGGERYDRPRRDQEPAAAAGRGFGGEDRRPTSRRDGGSDFRQRRGGESPAGNAGSRSPRPPNRDSAPSGDARGNAAGRDFQRTSSRPSSAGRPYAGGDRGKPSGGSADSRDDRPGPRRGGQPAGRSGPRTGGPSAGQGSASRKPYSGGDRGKPSGGSADSRDDGPGPRRSGPPAGRSGPRAGGPSAGRGSVSRRPYSGGGGERPAGAGSDSRDDRPQTRSSPKGPGSGRAVGNRAGGPIRGKSGPSGSDERPRDGRNLRRGSDASAKGPGERRGPASGGRPAFDRGSQGTSGRSGDSANEGNQGRGKPFTRDQAPRQGSRGATKPGAGGFKKRSASDGAEARGPGRAGPAPRGTSAKGGGVSRRPGGPPPRPGGPPERQGSSRNGPRTSTRR